MQSAKYRVDVLRNGVLLDQLFFDVAPQISCNSTAQIATTLRGTFVSNPRVNYISDELRPMIIRDGVASPLGVFCIGTRKVSIQENGARRDTIEAYDRCVRLSWAKLEKRDFWPKGTPYQAVIEHYVAAAGVPRLAFTSNEATLQTDREDWDIGTSYLTICNQLLNEMGYRSLYCDARGLMIAAPRVDPSAANIKHSFGTRDTPGAMLQMAMTQELDLFDAPNVFIAYVENPDLAQPLSAMAVNDSPTSPVSTANRGVRIPLITRLDNIASQDALQAYVDKQCSESRMTYEVVSISTAPRSGHGVSDTVALVHDGASGIYEETGWSLTLAEGSLMTHTLRKAVLV